MAKPNPQTGHGPLGGAANESTLPHGETSRRGSDGETDTPRADWQVADARDDSSVSRVLGVVLVLVLAGVFSFVAYRKYNEAPAPSADRHDGRRQRKCAAGRNRQIPQERTGYGGDREAGGAGRGQRIRVSANAGIERFRRRISSDREWIGVESHGDETRRERTAKTGPNGVARGGSESLQRSRANSPPPNTANPKTPQPGTNSSQTPTAVAAEDSRNDQSEPLFNEGGAKTPGPAEQKAGLAAATNGFAPTPGASINSAKPPIPASAASSTPSQFQPVKTAQNEPANENWSATAKPVPSQGEPAAKDCLNASPRTSDVAKNDSPAKSQQLVAAQPATAAGSLLDQETPLPAAAKGTAESKAAPGMAGAAASGFAQTAQAGNKTAVGGRNRPKD